MSATTLNRAASSWAEAEPCFLQKRSIDDLAGNLAETFGFAPGGDINELIHRLGGTIRYEDIEGWLETESGSIEVEERGEFTIYLPNFTSHVRDRFTMAHELGHYILHSGFGEKRIRVPRSGSNRLEWEANWFAAAFLMPRKKFLAELDARSSVALLAAKFDVSIEAAKVRKDSLGR